MPSDRRTRPLVPALIALALGVGGGVAVWLTWPDVGEPPPDPSAPRVGPERRPVWAQRAPRLPSVPGRVSAPPESRVAEAAEPADDTDPGEVFGPAWITGFVVDSKGTNVGGGRVAARCRVLDPEDGGLLEVSGTLKARADQGGFFELELTGPTRCEVVGMRRDGLLMAYSEPVELWVEPGEELDIDVVVPATRTGGIGVQFRTHADGIRVDRVHEGTPAWEAGLQRGDIIVQVEGVPAVDLGEQDFIRTMTGPEGSEVEFVVRYEQDGESVEESVQVRRQYLDRGLIR